MNHVSENILLASPSDGRDTQGALGNYLTINNIGLINVFKVLTKIPTLSHHATSHIFSGILPSSMYDHCRFQVKAVVCEHAKATWSQKLVGEMMSCKVRWCYTLSMIVDWPIHKMFNQ